MSTSMKHKQTKLIRVVWFPLSRLNKTIQSIRGLRRFKLVRSDRNATELSQLRFPAFCCLIIYSKEIENVLITPIEFQKKIPEKRIKSICCTGISKETNEISYCACAGPLRAY